MRIVTAGTSGFLGQRLLSALEAAGHQVSQLVRRTPEHPMQVRWDPDGGQLGPAVLDGADAVINLCGVGVADRRWTADYKELLISSRVRPTEVLSKAAAEAGVPVLLNASAIGWYGARGDEILTEDSPAGAGFFPDLCRQWETATGAAERAGTRVVHLRTGLVVGAEGGLLPQLKLVVRLFAGGRLGSGRQWYSWISADDEIGAMLHLLAADVAGPVNLTAPNPLRNKVFTDELGDALHRPTPWAVPGAALRLVLGEFAAEVLTGQRVLPTVLPRSGFRFSQPRLPEALAVELRR